MPDFPFALVDPRVNREEAPSIGWMLTGGQKFSTVLSYLGGGITPDAGNLSAFRAALGNASNAGVWRMTETRHTYISEALAEVFDEVYNDGTVAVCKLQNNNGQVATFEFPNPDLALFEADRVTLVRPVAAGTPGQVLVNAIAVAAQDLINNSFDPVNSYVWVSGALAFRKVKRTKPRTMPSISEPGVGENPPPAPAP